VVLASIMHHELVSVQFKYIGFAKVIGSDNFIFAALPTNTAVP